MVDAACTILKSTTLIEWFCVKVC